MRPRWLETELRHSVIAFGGGALLAAVALVLVPEGSAHLSPAVSVACFVGGGALFLFVDRTLARNPAGSPQMLAMLLDFVPESVAMGAAFASGSPAGPLLALLIGMQNLPEGFNAYRELLRACRTCPRGSTPTGNSSGAGRAGRGRSSRSFSSRCSVR
jgi:ZIP family zinc transporter